MSLIVFGLFLIPLVSAQISGYPQITEQFCDAMIPCPEGLECFSFPGIGLRCTQPNPCSYYKCPIGTQCVVAESYPGQVICSCVGPECPAASGAEETVEYDLLTQTVIHVIKPDEQTVSHNISLWKATPGNKSILETALASAEYSNELVVENSKLFMRTSAGKKQINVLPEEAIGVSETPNIGSIKKIELEEESQRPIYSVEGEKPVKILGIFSITLGIETKVSAETGDVISVNKPWWSFIAW